MKLKLIVLFLLMSVFSYGQNATIKEEMLDMKTYMFSDPDPVPEISRIYPYFRFDGYTNKGEMKKWKMVVLENRYIKVYVCPDVGGKVWGAIEKSTGEEFLYFNDVVKFRDVAMRGSWTSGGLEYNFGDIGHIPTCATPVDYVINEKEDGSVSCTVGAIDLPSGTKWSVEISLQKDKAYFETKASWFNTSSLPVTYYHWMNAAAKASGNLEFIYPGNKRIGHGGEVGEWPNDNGTNISWYENNNFGFYKSYHVINSYSNFFGGYWHDDDFGFGHYADYDDKPGKKIWIWGLSDQGMIWEDLLTDSNGQYIEFQAGKLFNQAAASSTLTPFKHKEFTPYDTGIMHELWFPLKETKGMVVASEYGVLNVERDGNQVNMFLSPLQNINSDLTVTVDGKSIYSKKIESKTLELFTDSLSIDITKDFTVELGYKQLVYISNKEGKSVNRPVKAKDEFNWESAYGLYIKGLEQEKQRQYSDARLSYLESYKTEPTFTPTLNRLALSYYRSGDYDEALKYTTKALSIDAYDGLTNYLFGLVNVKLGNVNDAKSGFSIACQSLSVRSASYTELAKLFMKVEDFVQAKKYAGKALAFNASNINAIEINAIIFRKENKQDEALKTVLRIEEMDMTDHFSSFEKYLLGNQSLATFNSRISNELPVESYLYLASKYIEYGCEDDALAVLENAPENPIVLLWRAYLDRDNETALSEKSLAISAEMVFPHRVFTGEVLSYFKEKNSSWKLNYYLALQQWSIGNIKYAQSLFKECGDTPDLAAFYLAKVKLFDFDNDITLNAMERADKLSPDDWRVKLAKINYYYRTDEFELAKKLAKETFKKYPEKAVIGMLYAKTLIKLKEYKSCLNFLERFDVLPYEGATEGRNIYHEVCIRLSLSAMDKKSYSNAIKYATKAKVWPKKLGVGKPYDVDERVDNYLIAYAYEKQGNKELASDFYNKIIEHQTPVYLNENSKLYFQLMVAKKLGNDRLIAELKEKYSSKAESNRYVGWAFAMFEGGNADELSKKILNSDTEIQAYDTKFVDAEFTLVNDVLQLLK